MSWYNFNSQWFNNLGSISSILGIIFTIIILIKVSNIKKSFVKKIRYNEILKELKQETLSLSKIVFNFENNKSKIKESFSEIKAILKSINLEKKDKELEELRLSIIQKFDSIVTFNSIDCENIYTDLIEFRGMLEQKVKDLKWEDNE